MKYEPDSDFLPAEKPFESSLSEEDKKTVRLLREHGQKQREKNDIIMQESSPF